MRKNIYAEIYNIKHGQHRHTRTHIRAARALATHIKVQIYADML